MNEDRRRVILTLTGERQIEGWAYEWPDQPDSGHFVLVNPWWIVRTEGKEEADLIALTQVKRILISAKEVEIVEIMLTQEEIDEEKKLKGELNGKQSTTAIAAPNARASEAEAANLCCTAAKEEVK